MPVNFVSQTDFTLKNKQLIRQWLKALAQLHSRKLGEISYIFMDDEGLLQVNKEYLQHDFYTDIITFDYVENDTLSGDIFISVDRVKDNAKTYNASAEDEMIRVLAHGVLHLVGFKDHNPDDEVVMRQQEDNAIALYKKLEEEKKNTKQPVRKE